MAEKEFQPGEKVEWNSASGRVVGTVEEKLTEPAMIKGHKVAASEENPEYLVHSDKTGARAAHKPEALTSLDRPGEEESGTEEKKKKSTNNKKRDREEEKEEEEEEKEKGEKEEKEKPTKKDEERAEKKEEKLTEEAQTSNKDAPKKRPKLDSDDAKSDKAAQAPAEERRQEQAASNE